eukprot:CAMPEP_0203967668 /NCGR_PEP_ID=MMETSP0359-20131031/96561_1 /ASSEMBLY_ACC=CAM_ASM_000338 /TAXON_ID=268821 /ORGANISM="Scrippsiella Hangoei, Strain SHTV-5" /LENGTH=339 /DNA_ID=CAMNT_0050905585 /DNA_START=103 /DNA_END=1122 /DNA_ORIENTATION=-
MTGPGSMCFMDAAALGGWTARGTARVLQDRFAALPADQRPAWMQGLSPQKMEELLTKVIVDSVEASQIVQDYMDSERAKGRDFEEIYSEVKPYLDRVSRPIDEDMTDGTYDPSFTEEAPFVGDVGRAYAEVQIHAQAAAREHARQTAPHQNLAAWFDIGSPGAGNRSQGSAAAADPAAPSTGQPAAPPPDLLREEDLDEPLMAIGSCNGWRVDEARRLHCFEPCLDSPPELRVRVLRLRVPASGVQFQILSREKGWQWLLFPSHKGTLHRGEARSVAAALGLGPDADEKSRSQDFRVKGEKGPIVEVRVSLTLERGARVWFTEVHDDEPLAAITFPGME